ncbi:MAG: Arm DNA-binding domain-containing protein, partial [Flavobacteriaceae bacterium]
MVSLLFYLKKSKPDSEGRAMIYLRITVKGRRAELSTGRKTYPHKWNASQSM